MRFFRLTHLLFLSLETLIFIIKTGLLILVELIYLVNSVINLISNELTQMFNFLTQIPDCDSHSPALLDLYLSSDVSICSTMAFPPLGTSDYAAVSVSIDFPLILQGHVPFQHIAYDFSRADWDGLHDDLRHVPWEDTFKLGASAAASEFC